MFIIHPSSYHKLLNTWIGPATVIEFTRPHSVVLKLEDGNTRNLNVNKILPFIPRVDRIGLIFEQYPDFGDLHCALNGKDSNDKDS